MNRIYIIGQTKTPRLVEKFFIHRKLTDGTTQWLNSAHALTESLAETKSWVNNCKDIIFRLELTYDD